jgi:hypothetical protein
MADTKQLFLHLIYKPAFYPWWMEVGFHFYPFFTAVKQKQACSSKHKKYAAFCHTHREAGGCSVQPDAVLIS